jgi:hypothetical protein
VQCFDVLDVDMLDRIFAGEQSFDARAFHGALLWLVRKG